MGGGCLDGGGIWQNAVILWLRVPSIYTKAHKTCCLCEHVWLNLSGYHFSFCQWKMKSVSQSCKGYVFVFLLGLSQTDKREVTAWAAAGDSTSRSRCKVTGVIQWLYEFMCVCMICDRNGENKKYRKQAEWVLIGCPWQHWSTGA